MASGFKALMLSVLGSCCTVLSMGNPSSAATSDTATVMSAQTFRSDEGWKGGMPDPVKRLDPRINRTLSSADDQGAVTLPLGLGIACEAHYSYGTAVSPEGEVYFTEFNKMRVRKFNPQTRELETVISNRGGLYGIAFDREGNMFLGIDGDIGKGKVVRRTPNGKEKDIITGLTRPRQVTCDTNGNVYVAVEADRNIKKWNRTSGEVTTILDEIPTIQGVAVADNGDVYYSQYSTVVHGVMMKPGYVGVVRSGGTREIVASGFWRARGLALHPGGDLYLVTEANVWDQGNSGWIVRLDPKSGDQQVVLSGFDYPQFPSIGADGKLHVTMGRDNKLVFFDPEQSFTEGVIANAGLKVAVAGATWSDVKTVRAVGITIEIDKLVVEGYLNIHSGETDAGIWLEIPARLLNLSLEELPYHTPERPTPGIFELPAVTATSSSGVCKAFVIPKRNHTRCRWPMNYETGREMPPSDFFEEPVAYWVYLKWVRK